MFVRFVLMHGYVQWIKCKTWTMSDVYIIWVMHGLQCILGSLYSAVRVHDCCDMYGTLKLR